MATPLPYDTKSTDTLVESTAAQPSAHPNSLCRVGRHHPLYCRHFPSATGRARQARLWWKLLPKHTVDAPRLDSRGYP